MAHDEGAVLLCIAQGCPSPEYRLVWLNNSLKWKNIATEKQIEKFIRTTEKIKREEEKKKNVVANNLIVIQSLTTELPVKRSCSKNECDYGWKIQSI